jgi:hypothetical protein
LLYPFLIGEIWAALHGYAIYYRTKAKHTNVRAFVVLRSMEGKGKLQYAHSQGRCMRYLQYFCLCGKTRKRFIENFYYYGSW